MKAIQSCLSKKLKKEGTLKSFSFLYIFWPESVIFKVAPWQRGSFGWSPFKPHRSRYRTIAEFILTSSHQTKPVWIYPHQTLLWINQLIISPFHKQYIELKGFITDIYANNIQNTLNRNKHQLSICWNNAKDHLTGWSNVAAPESKAQAWNRSLQSSTDFDLDRDPNWNASHDGPNDDSGKIWRHLVDIKLTSWWSDGLNVEVLLSLLLLLLLMLLAAW